MSDFERFIELSPLIGTGRLLINVAHILKMESDHRGGTTIYFDTSSSYGPASEKVTESVDEIIEGLERYAHVHDLRVIHEPEVIEAPQEPPLPPPEPPPFSIRDLPFLGVSRDDS